MHGSGGIIEAKASGSKEVALLWDDALNGGKGSIRVIAADGRGGHAEPVERTPPPRPVGNGPALSLSGFTRDLDGDRTQDRRGRTRMRPAS